MGEISNHITDNGGKNMFQSIVEAICGTMNMPARFWIFDEQTQTLRVAAAVGARENFTREAILKLDDQTATVEAFKEGKVVAVRDIFSDPRWKYKDEAREMGHKSVLCVPVRAEDSVIGVISIFAFLIRDFSDLEKQLLENYANQIGMTLEVTRQRDMLNQMLVIGHDIQKLITCETKVVLGEIAKKACEIVGADCAVFYPYDHRRANFYDPDSVSSYGLSKKLNPTGKPRTTEGMAAYVKREGEVIVSNIEEKSDMAESPFIKRERIKAFMGIALKLEETVFGILYINFRRPYRFTSFELNTIRLFAQQASTAILNTRFIEQRNTLQEIARDITSIMDKDILIQRILERSLDLLGCNIGCICLLSRDKTKLEFQYAVNKERFDSVDMGMGLVSQALESKKPVRVGDVSKEPHYVMHVPEVRSELDIPLLIGDKLIGILNTESTVLNAFGKAEESLGMMLAEMAAVAIERAGLFERITKLQKLSTLISSQLDLDKTLQTILEGALYLVDCPAGSIGLLNEETREFEFKYASGQPQSVLASDKGLTGVAAKTKKPVRSGNVAADPRYVKHNATTVSELDVPLMIGDSVIGVLNIVSPLPDAFEKEDEDILLALASQAAVAIFNADVFQQTRVRLEQRLEDLKALQNVFDAIGKKPVKEILNLVVRRAADLTQAEYGNLWLLDRKKNELRFGTEVNLLASDPLRNAVLPVNGKSINGFVAMTGKPYLCEDVSTDEHYHTINEGVRSELTAPLRRGDKIIGTLNLESTKIAAFNKDHEKILEALCGQAAIAIENARLYERMNVLASIGEKATSTLELDEILKQILQKAVDSLESDFGTLRLVDRTTGKLELKAYVGSVADETRQVLEKGEGTLGRVADSGESLIVPDVNQDKWYVPVLKGSKSAITVPIKAGNETIGVINIEDSDVNAFDEHDLSLLEAISSQTANTVRNAMLYQALAGLGEAAISGVRLREDEVLELIYKQIAGIMTIENMYIALYDDLNDSVSFGLAIEDGRRVDIEPRKAGKGRTEEIIQTKKPIFTATKKEAKEWYEQPGHKEYVGKIFASWLGVPVMLGEKMLGVIAVYHSRENVFVKDDLMILQAMANQAAIALDNSRLFYDVNSRLEALVEFGKEVTASVHRTEEDVLNSIFHQTSRVMDTNNLYVALYDDLTDIVRFGLAYKDGKRVDIQTEKGWGARKAGQGRTEVIIRTKTPVFNATRKDAEEWYAQPGHKEYIGTVLASWIGVPMMIGEKVLGVIATYHNEKEYIYNRDDLNLLQAIADLAAIALNETSTFNAWKNEQKRRIEDEKVAYLGHAAESIAHRVNNTIGLIPLCVTDIRTHLKNVDAYVEEQLDMIKRNSGYILELSKELMKPAAMSDLASFNVNRLVKDAIDYSTIPPDIEVIPQLDDHLPKILTNRLLVDVFVELITNAVSAMEKSSNKRLEISSRQLPGTGCVEVRFTDTGKGISEEELERLFVLFYTTKEKKNSAEGVSKGFGLWWIKTSLIRQGGDISVESEINKGTTFRVRLVEEKK